MPEGSFGPIVTPQSGVAQAFVQVKWSDWVRSANQLRIDYEFKIPTGESFAETKVAITFEVRRTSDALMSSVAISIFPGISPRAETFSVLMSSKAQKVWGWSAWVTPWRRRRTTGFLKVKANPTPDAGTQIEIASSEDAERIVEIYRLGDPISFSVWRASELVVRLVWGNDQDFARDYGALRDEVAGASH